MKILNQLFNPTLITTLFKTLNRGGRREREIEGRISRYVVTIFFRGKRIQCIRLNYYTRNFRKI